MILFISLILETIVSNVVGINSIFIPLFFIMSLILIYPKEDYLIICFICGLIYDICFYNSLFINTISFILIGLLIPNLKKYNIYFKSIIVIIFYRFISYFMLVLIGYTKFNINLLFKSIYSSIILNIIFIILVKLCYNIKRKW